MERFQNDMLVYRTKRPLWHYAIAIPLYAFIIPLVYKIIDLFFLQQFINGLKFILVVVFVFICGAGLTFTKRIYTNSDLKNLRFNFTLFGIKLGKDDVFTDVKYISVYKNNSDRDFEIKVWLTETKKKTVSVLFNAESAFEFASYLAKGLDVQLLDATEKGNFKWIENKSLS